jgi:hypothetical protein
MAENIRRALLQDVSDELAGLEERRLQAAPPIVAFIPLIDRAVETMVAEAADDPEGYDRARDAFVELVGRARAASAERGASTVEAEDVQAALRGFCPRWPIC